MEKPKRNVCGPIRELARFYSEMTLWLGAADLAYEVLYGPVIPHLDVLFVVYQPGGGSAAHLPRDYPRLP